MKEIVERLREKNIVLTPQRLAVMEFLNNNTTHPTADEIYNQLKKKYPAISLATVYKNLDVLKEAGEVKELTIIKEKSFWDFKTEPHGHFFCRVCKRVFDIDFDHSVLKKIPESGHAIENVEVYFYGVCSDCLVKQKTAEKEKQL